MDTRVDYPETARIDRLIAWTKGPRVLDVGCMGYDTRVESPHFLHGRLRTAFPEVHGIDLAADAIDVLRGRGWSNLSAMSAEEIDLPQRFETVVASEVIGHLSNPGRFLERARGHLAPGGRLVLTIPSPFSLLYSLYSWQKYPRTNSDPTLACWFCPQTLRHLAERHGLRVVHWELIEDHDLRRASSLYRRFVSAMKVVARVLPERVRANTILFVLEPEPLRDRALRPRSPPCPHRD
jgi:SAM-dependent methyltransferase